MALPDNDPKMKTQKSIEESGRNHNNSNQQKQLRHTAKSMPYCTYTAQET